MEVIQIYPITVSFDRALDTAIIERTDGKHILSQVVFIELKRAERDRVEPRWEGWNYRKFAAVSWNPEDTSDMNNTLTGFMGCPFVDGPHSGIEVVFDDTPDTTHSSDWWGRPIS